MDPLTCLTLLRGDMMIWTAELDEEALGFGVTRELGSTGVELDEWSEPLAGCAKSLKSMSQQAGLG